MKTKQLSRFHGFILVCLTGAVSVSASAADAFIQKTSKYGVSETLDRLESVLKEKGITIFARVDHAAGAKKVGLQMTDTQLLIFGNPEMGTPLMNEQRLVGLDLPMKVLAWKDASGQTWIAYTSPDALKSRHQLKNEKIINKMKNALNGITSKALE